MEARLEHAFVERMEQAKSAFEAHLGEIQAAVHTNELIGFFLAAVARRRPPGCVC